MSWIKLRPQVVALVETISTLQEVSAAPKIRFTGYPAAHVVPSDNTGDFETTAENERRYALLVRVFAETKSQGIEKAFESLEEVVDNVIDTFDQEDQKGSERIVGVALPSNYTFINIFAAPSRWAEFPDEELVMAEITVRIRISIDVT